MIRAAVQVWHFLRRIAEDVGFLVCPVGNQQFEVLLAEGNLFDGLYAVATASRPTAVRVVNWKRHSMQLSSGIQCVLNFSASHDSRCFVFCLPLLLSVALRRPRLPRRVRGHRHCLWCRNRCVPQRPQLQRWHVHRILRAFRVFFFSPCTAGSCLFTDPCFSPILDVSNHFQTVFPSCGIKRACVLVERTNGKNNLNRVFRLRWLCEGRACRVQPFMLSLSVFL